MSTGEPDLQSLAEQKRQIRAMLRQRLAAITPEQRHTKSLAIAALASATPEWQKAGTILLYLSLPDEVETRPLLEDALAQGKRLAVPKVIDESAREMSAVAVHSLEEADLPAGHYGVRVPRGEHEPIPAGEIDLVIVPGLGFSRRGARIGRGLGYYDRYLARADLRAKRCGLAFSAQVLDELPGDRRDISVHMLVTESEVFRV